MAYLSERSARRHLLRLRRHNEPHRGGANCLATLASDAEELGIQLEFNRVVEGRSALKKRYNSLSNVGHPDKAKEGDPPEITENWTYVKDCYQELTRAPSAADMPIDDWPNSASGSNGDAKQQPEGARKQGPRWHGFFRSSPIPIPSPSAIDFGVLTPGATSAPFLVAVTANNDLGDFVGLPADSSVELSSYNGTFSSQHAGTYWTCFDSRVENVGHEPSYYLLELECELDAGQPSGYLSDSVSIRFGRHVAEIAIHVRVLQKPTFSLRVSADGLSAHAIVDIGEGADDIEIEIDWGDGTTTMA